MKRQIMATCAVLLLGIALGITIAYATGACASSPSLSYGLEVAAPRDVKCPIDGSVSFFTGKNKTDVSGKLLYLYRCTKYAHEFWVPAN